MDQLEQRMQILEEQAVIDKEVGEQAREVVQRIRRMMPSFQEERWAGFCVHYAMALQRIRTKEQVEPMEECIRKEMEDSGSFVRAQDFYRELFAEETDVIDARERDYLLLHLCSVLEQEEL